MRAKSPIHGLMAEFDDPNALVVAAQRARHEGYRRMDAYSPFPIEELHDALGRGDWDRAHDLDEQLRDLQDRVAAMRVTALKPRSTLGR